MSVGVGSPSVLILRLYKHCQETNTGSYRLCQCVYQTFTARKKPYYVYYFFSFFKKNIYLFIYFDYAGAWLQHMESSLVAGKSLYTVSYYVIFLQATHKTDLFSLFLKLPSSLLVSKHMLYLTSSLMMDV